MILFSSHMLKLTSVISTIHIVRQSPRLEAPRSFEQYWRGLGLSWIGPDLNWRDLGLDGRGLGLERRNSFSSTIAHLLLDTFRFLRALFSGLIPAFRSYHMSALFYWHLAAFFNRNFNALFGGNLPATDLRNVSANLLGNGTTTFLGHLLATLVRHLMARRVSHRGANALRTLATPGTWFLPARHNWEVLALLFSGGAASLLRDLDTHRVLHQLADLVGHSLTLGDGLLPAGNHRHILAFLLLDGLAHSVGNLLADRIGHRRANLVGKGGALGLWFLPASFNRQLGALLTGHLFTHLPVGTLLHRNKPADSLGLRLSPPSRPLASDFYTRSFVHSRPLPLAELGVGLAWGLRGNFETFLDLFIPAAVHNLTFFGLLVVASFFLGSPADFRVLSLAVLRGLIVAHLALDVLALLGSLNCALLAARLVALLLLLR